MAVQARYQSGLGNLLDVETARRYVLSAELAVKELEQEQVSAWIALYRAAGGSWSDSENSPIQAAEVNNRESGNTDPMLIKNNSFTGGKL